MEYVSEWYLIYEAKDEMFQNIDGPENLAGTEYLKDEYMDHCRMVKPNFN